MTCPHRYSDGAYVLGALSPAERSEYEQHLAGCDTCAAAVRQLAPLPGLLGRVDTTAAEGGTPPSVRLPRLLEAASQLRHRETRVRRWRLAAVAATAAVVAAAGAGVVSTLPSDPAPGTDDVPVASEDMRPVAPWAPVSAQIGLAAGPSGTRVSMTCRYDESRQESSPYTFRLVAVGTDGTSEQVGSWRAGPGDQIEMSGVTRFTGADLARVELHAEDGTRVLVHEP